MSAEVISVLPYNATPQERAQEAATSRLGHVPVPVRAMWNPDTCPAAQLPWLAWALSVDEWDPDWTDAQKRAAIAASFAVHQRKGTAGAVKIALQALGFGTEVTEWFQTTPAGDPYTFEISVDFTGRPLEIGVLEQAEAVAVSTKNVRSHLTRVRGIGSIRGESFIGIGLISGEETRIEPFQLVLLTTNAGQYVGLALVTHETATVLPIYAAQGLLLTNGYPLLLQSGETLGILLN